MERISKLRQKLDICCGLRYYLPNLISSILLLIYCSLRSILLYDMFVCFKATKDIILVVSLLFEVFNLIVWLFVLALITRKSDWDFQMDAIYRLVYWNKAYEARLRRMKEGLLVERVVNGRSSFVHNRGDEIIKTSQINNG